MCLVTTTTIVVPLTSSIGGLRTFAAPAGGGPTRASLTFRVGWADERLAEHGITHLVEHLVLAPLGRPQFPWNGNTGPERVTFFCEGTEAQVAWFFAAVAANIKALPLQQLEVEKNLIRAEACHRNGGVAGMHDLWRWGTRGHGLGIHDELGLDHLTAERVQGWAAQFLTAENAVLWTTAARPVPLGLPRGTARPAPEPGDWRATPTPSYFPLQGTRVTLSAELKNGHWAGVVGHLLVKRLLERLRYLEGVSYSADFDVVTVGGDLRRLLVTVDGLPDRMPEVAAGAVAVVSELAESGPLRDELAEVVTAWNQQRQRDTWVLAELTRLSEDFLVGRPSPSPDDLLRELQAFGPQQVAAVVQQMLPTVLWSAPPGVVVPACAPAPTWSDHRVTGSRWTPPRGQLQTNYVDVSDQGITCVYEREGGATVTVLWDDCTAVVAFSDGALRVIGKDGMAIVLYPERWDRWDQLRAAIEMRVPAGRWAPQRHTPSREAPRPPVVQVQPTSDGAWIAVGVVCLAFTALMVVASQSEGFDPVALAVLLPILAVSALPIGHVRRRRARLRAGLEPVRIRRYTGVASWPTRYVVASLALAVPGAAAAWLSQIWIVGVGLTAIAIRAGRELRRRHQRDNPPTA